MAEGAGHSSAAERVALRSRRASSTRFFSSFSALRHSATTAASPSPGGTRRTMTTTSASSGKRSRVARNASRTRRLARFRTTAPPTLRDAVTPRRALSPGQGGRALTISTKFASDTRRPRVWISRYSRRFRTRSRFGKGPRGTQPNGALIARASQPEAKRQTRGRGESDLWPRILARQLLLVRGDGQTPAPLTATVGENLATAFGAVALAEAVSTKAADGVGLIRALHGCTVRVGRGADFATEPFPSQGNQAGKP